MLKKATCRYLKEKNDKKKKGVNDERIVIRRIVKSVEGLDFVIVTAIEENFITFK